MSNILDALRKSEQERQAHQPDKVTERILIHQLDNKRINKRWLVALGICNLVFLCLAVWLWQQKQTAFPDMSDSANKNTDIKPYKTEKQPEIKPYRQTIDVNDSSPSIEHMVESQKKADSTFMKPEAVKVNPNKKPAAAKKIVPPNTKATIAKPVEYNQQEELAPSLTKPSKQGVVDINELPYDIRNSLPNLTINVFSYGEKPEERFVIIDMIKYKVGQSIKGTVRIKALLPDHLILQKDNVIFKMSRP
jgi:general secretion pathway protein B